MTGPEFIIERGLPEHLRQRAAEILDEAFGEKLSLAIPDRERRVAFLGRTVRARNCLIAVDGDQLWGLVCLNAPRGEFKGEILDTDALGIGGWRELLGLFGSIRTAIMLRTFFSHEAKPDEIYIEFIAVSPSARGHGLGASLLGEAKRAAQEGDFDCVRLDVVDTNPRAQALYEREGYRVVHEERLGLLSRVTGFESAYTMECPVGRAES